MSRKILISIFFIIGLVVIFYIMTPKESNDDPVTFTADSLIEDLSIDDKIKNAELIIIGKVNATLPSKWKKQNEKDIKDATPREIFEFGLFTDSIISVDQILKGDYKEGAIRVRSYIGKTEHVELVNESEPIFENGQIYLLFLEKDIGPTAIVDPGDYISVNSYAAVYAIVNGKAISADDEWVLEELIAYIEKTLASDALSPTLSPTPFDLLTETLTALPSPTETPTQPAMPDTPSPEPSETSTETPTPTETPIP